MDIEQRLADIERRVAALEEADSRRKRRTPVTSHLPADVVAQSWQVLIGRGMTGDEIKQEYTRFCNHAVSTGRLCAGLTGWQAAWRNWTGKK